MSSLDRVESSCQFYIGKNVKKSFCGFKTNLTGTLLWFFCVKCWIIMIEIYVRFRFDLLTSKVRQGFPWDFQRIKSQQHYICSWWSFKCHKLLFFSLEYLFAFYYLSLSLFVLIDDNVKNDQVLWNNCIILWNKNTTTTQTILNLGSRYSESTQEIFWERTFLFQYFCQLEKPRPGFPDPTLFRPNSPGLLMDP